MKKILISHELRDEKLAQMEIFAERYSSLLNPVVELNLVLIKQTLEQDIVYSERLCQWP